jgi:hypothetical protein
MTDYAVVLLVEQELSTLDAHQVRGLHEDIDEPVRYHVLLPVEDAAYRVESAMGSLGSAEMANPGLLVDEAEIAEMQSEILTSARTALKNTVAALEAAGGTAVGDLLTADPIDGLIAKVAETDAAEAIILTRPHVVSEFFHLDWTSRARRKLGVPCCTSSSTRTSTSRPARERASPVSDQRACHRDLGSRSGSLLPWSCLVTGCAARRVLAVVGRVRPAVDHRRPRAKRPDVGQRRDLGGRGDHPPRARVGAGGR